jgi:hypothetical protein
VQPRAPEAGAAACASSAASLGPELRLWIAREALRALAVAWWIRTARRPEVLRLPPTAPRRAWTDEATPAVVAWVDALVRVLVAWKRARCFYRSYALACVGRRGGVPLLLNLGYRGLGGPGRPVAHCWLTLEGELFAERAGTARHFPLRIGGVPGQVDYHLGPPDPG